MKGFLKRKFERWLSRQLRKGRFQLSWDAGFLPDKKVKVQIGDVWLELDGNYKHERDYFRYWVLGKKYPQSEIDRLVFERFIDEDGSFLDLGANIGFTALLAAQCGASKVLAVEAVPEIFERLKKVELPGMNVVHAAISAESGFGDIYVSSAHNQGSTTDYATVERFRDVFPRELRVVKVPFVTIDSIVSDFYCFWKFDIEGAELAALQGARMALEKYTPNYIYMEIYDSRVLSEISGLLREFLPYCYRVYVSKAGGLLVSSSLSGEAGLEVESHSPSYIFSRVRL